MAIQEYDLHVAIKNAKYFLEAAESLKHTGKVFHDGFDGGSVAATVKRRSMELTKSLAVLRK